MSDLKLGLRPNDPTRPRLRFADYIKGIDLASLPPAPATSDVLTGLSFKIWLNNILGCCVAATAGGLLLVDSARLGGKPYTVADTQILTWYQTQNPGADPAHPGVHDNGMSIQVFLTWLLKHPFPDGSKVLGFAEIDPKNLAEVRVATAIGGRIWTACTITAANRTQWDAGEPFDYVAGSPVEGGHSILVGGEDAVAASDLELATWAAIRRASDAFLAHQISEMWLVITDRMLGSKRFVAGMDLATFAADYAEITGRPFPAPVPPAPVPFTPRSAMNYTAIDPVRVIDSRVAGGKLMGNAPKVVQVTTGAVIPAGATAVTGNLTIVKPSKAGWAALTPLASVPAISMCNFAKGQGAAPNAFTIGPRRPAPSRSSPPPTPTSSWTSPATSARRTRFGPHRQQPRLRDLRGHLPGPDRIRAPGRLQQSGEHPDRPRLLRRHRHPGRAVQRLRLCPGERRGDDHRRHRRRLGCLQPLLVPARQPVHRRSYPGRDFVQLPKAA